MTVVAYDLVHRTGIQHAQEGYPLEKRIQRGFSVGGHWWRNAGQPFLNRALQRGLDIFAGQAGEALRELIKFGGTDVHEATIKS
jgi:hypothetical protein